MNPHRPALRRPTGLGRYLPFLSWVPGYDRRHLKSDTLAGLTTAVMLIPQGMAYAMLAGLDPIIGLYASVVPLVLYALFGTSRQLAVGPVAMVSLLVASGVGAIAEPGSGDYLAYAVLLALMVGVLQLVMGLVRMGFLTNFLSHPVISGFTSAAALIIGFSQLQHLLGIDIPRSKHVHEIVASAAAHIGDVHLTILTIGVISIALLVLLEKYAPSFPRALLVVVLGTGAVALFGLEAAGVKIVGEVPGGLPAPAFPLLDGDAMGSLMPIAITIALVGFMESISVAKVFARRHRYELDPNQELVGLGVANIGGSLFLAYPVTGGLSRTAVNDQAGARTGMAAIVTAAFIALTLLFFTPLFYYLPKAVLAAIIMVAVFGLIDVEEVKHLWKVKKSDLVLLLVTFGATLGLGIEEGILVGVGASLLWFVVRTTRPHTAVLGRLPGTCAYRNVKNYPEAQTFDSLLIVRMDAQLYFGNVTFLKDTLRDLEVAMEDRGQPLRAVVLEAASMNQIDASAEQALEGIIEDYTERGISLRLATVKHPVRQVLERSGLVDTLGEDHLHLDVHQAVEAALRDIDRAEHRPTDAPRAESPDASQPGRPSAHRVGQPRLSHQPA